VVLSLPHRLRYLLAWDHELCRAVVGVFVRTVLAFLRKRARREGLADGRSGAVVVVQRFGGALNLNIHLHALVLDGVYGAGAGGLQFHPIHRLTRDDVAEVVRVAARRIERLIERRGLVTTAEECSVESAWAEQAPALAGLAAASVQEVLALGPRPGGRVARFRPPLDESPPVRLGPCHAGVSGFDLHAGLVVRAGERERLERLCRYALRPPVADARLRVDAEGQAWMTLRHPWADGTRHLRFDPLNLLGRLAVLTPRPRINLVLYYGVLGPRAAWRRVVVASAGSAWSDVPAELEARAGADDAAARRRGYLWAELMRRTFGLDVLACPGCGGRLRLMAVIGQGPVLERILRHLGLPTDRPELRPGRAPPRNGFDDDSRASVAADATF
jgi:hypothetical protein